MCFYHDDYDWTPSICEESEGPLKTVKRCTECNKRILEGQWALHIYYQEHEECQNCEADDRYDVDCDHDYGHSYDYYSCERCERLREAIRRVEEAEGCSGNEAEPSRGGMYTDVGDGEGWDHYAFEYAKLFPGEYVPWPINNYYNDELADEYDNYYCSAERRPEEVVMGGEA